MKVTELAVKCDAEGEAVVEVWVKCATRDDLDDVIAWLELAKQMVGKWQKIRKRDDSTVSA